MKRLSIFLVNLIHTAVVIYVLIGWLISGRNTAIAYLVIVWGIFLIQKLHQGVCPLTQAEWKLRGRWPEWREKNWTSYQSGRLGLKLSQKNAEFLLRLVSLTGTVYSITKIIGPSGIRKVRKLYNQ